jgi:hypothetical protein
LGEIHVDESLEGIYKFLFVQIQNKGPEVRQALEAIADAYGFDKNDIIEGPNTTFIFVSMDEFNLEG